MIAIAARTLRLARLLSFLTSVLVAAQLNGVAVAQEDGKFELTVKPLSSFTPFPLVTAFGALEWRGGFEVSSKDRRFGGFSGLALSKDGSRLVAVSDRGWWLRARLVYESGHLAGIDNASMAPMLDSKGKIIRSKVRNDAEALAAWVPGEIDGRLIAGFESRVRIGTFETMASPFKPLNAPADIAKGPANHELEGIGRFHDGRFEGSFIAVSEDHRDAAGNIRAWIWSGKRQLAFAIKPYGDYAITDIAILFDGDILTLERSFGKSVLPGTAIRRIAAMDVLEGAALSPQLLFEARAPYHQIDNMEGIAIARTGSETRITLISDDNFNRSLQRTLILQFTLKP